MSRLSNIIWVYINNCSWWKWKTFDQWSASGFNWCWNFYQHKYFRYKKPPTSYNEQVRKICARRFVTFYFLLVSSIQCVLSVGIRSYFTQRNVCRKIGQMYLSIVKEYFSVEVTHNLRITWMNNTPPKKFFLLILSIF